MPASRLLGVVLFLAGCAALPASLWWSTTERATAAAAEVIRARATPDDLVLISSSLSPAAPDPAGLMRPLGALAVTVLDPAGPLPELASFPHERVFLVGDFPLARLGASAVAPLGAGVHEVRVPRTGRPLGSLLGQLRISTRAPDGVTPCNGRHPGGGVRCGGQPWQYVGPVVVVVEDRLVACLWAHPVQHRVLDLVIPAGAGAASLWLQYAGEALRDPERPPVVAELSVGGNVLARAECTNRGSGRCPLGAELPSGTAAATVSVSTADAGRQLVCLGGEVPAP